MDEQKNLSFGRRLRFALAGLGSALRTERSLKTQAAFLVVVIITLVILQPAPIWWALLILASAGVLAAELFNTAIEQLADHLHPEQHPAIRIVKDCAAAGVLLAVVGAIGVGIAFFMEVIGS